MNSIVTLIIVSSIIIGIALITFTLLLFGRNRKKRYQKELNELERNKNLIISASILSELNKVENLINNDKLRESFEEWKNRFKEIRDVEVPEITEQLNELEDYFVFRNENEIETKIAKIELEIYYVKMKARFLLYEIREITLSEERNRDTVTKLKSEYRNVIIKFKNNKDDYKEVISPIELQLENIDKLFSAFEISMETNSYAEVSKIVKAMNDTINNLKVIVDEAPSIIVMCKSIIPRKMDDIKKIYQKMLKDGYVLDYLNVDYNINESDKKLKDIISRLNVLNVEDSIFELKTIIDYFDSIYNEFDKEKLSKNLFEELARSIGVKISRLSKIGKDLLSKIEDIKFSYDLSSGDVEILQEINTDLDSINKNYEMIIETKRNKSFAFTKLSKELEHLNIKISKIEDRLENALRTLGSLKEDEIRAREQLDEIKDLLKLSSEKIKGYKLPITPKKYFIELSEAISAIKEIVKELEKKPISIKVLNVRVDTARDLVLKLYNTSKETTKTAKMAELAIIYGNRYRPINKDISLGLTKAELCFNKGNYRNSLENAINAINIVEPGIYKRLLESVKGK